MAKIPKEHEKYDLLPETRNDDTWECFNYPNLFELEALGLNGLDPYGFASVEQYNEMVDQIIATVESPVIINKLRALQEDMIRMNIKENWSVLRWLGDHFPKGYAVRCVDKGRCYYWPCDIDNPVYQGVIDNEEYTSYWYPTEPEMWEILEDPTGMAYRTIYGEKNHVSLDKWNYTMDHMRNYLEFIHPESEN